MVEVGQTGVRVVRMAFSDSPPRVALIYSDDIWRYGMGAAHPRRPVRWKRTFDLMDAAGLLQSPNVSILPPEPATVEDIQLFHSADYVGAVKALSSGLELPGGPMYGFGPGYNPVFSGMYEENALTSGGTMVAARALADVAAAVAFNVAGGRRHPAGRHGGLGARCGRPAGRGVGWLRRSLHLRRPRDQANDRLHGLSREDALRAVAELLRQLLPGERT